MAKPRDYTVQFRRQLSDADRAILLAAGRGDITVGFRELLSIYRHLYDCGFRPGMRPENLAVVTTDD